MRDGMLTLASLALGTLVSEDLTCIAAGVLVADGRLNLLQAIVACAAGIVAGDFGLWWAGKAGAAVIELVPWWRGRALSEFGERQPLVRSLRRHAGIAILASRFLPGTRLPLYLTAGAIGVDAWTFIRWCAIAACLWTPSLVLLAAGLGHGADSNVAASGGLVIMRQLAAAAAALPIVGLVRVAVVPSQRLKAMARLARWSRWEFWPMWFFYAPVAVWIAALTVRYRGLTMTAANPAIPDGGTVGESKFDILARLPGEAIIPSMRVDRGSVQSRTAVLREHAEREEWALPLVLKPDVGQRGVGVKLVRTWEEAAEYLARTYGAVLAQPYNDGPFEAGVFYYRLPHWERGRLLSVTDKVFPEVVGDGRSTLEALIWRHPRIRLQARVFLSRHRDASTRIPADGERVRLALAGNHAQGTLFRDGAHLMTPELEARIDGLARHRPGLFIGRFDIRYRSVDAFKAGRDIAVVELNGATAESTNIYDPDCSLWSAYRLLFRQWFLVFAIGAANRAAGAPVSSLGRLASLIRTHLTTRVAYQVSD